MNTPSQSLQMFYLGVDWWHSSPVLQLWMDRTRGSQRNSGNTSHSPILQRLPTLNITRIIGKNNDLAQLPSVHWRRSHREEATGKDSSESREIGELLYHTHLQIKPLKRCPLIHALAPQHTITERPFSVKTVFIELILIQWGEVLLIFFWTGTWISPIKQQ